MSILLHIARSGNTESSKFRTWGCCGFVLDKGIVVAYTIREW